METEVGAWLWNMKFEVDIEVQVYKPTWTLNPPFQNQELA